VIRRVWNASGAGCWRRHSLKFCTPSNRSPDWELQHGVVVVGLMRDVLVPARIVPVAFESEHEVFLVEHPHLQASAV
jgi:hypothetical protein